MSNKSSSRMLSEAELREGIRRHLRSQGHVENLTAELRQRLVTEFSLRKVKKDTLKGKNDENLAARVRWSVVVEVLKMYGLRNTLAIFIPESGLKSLEGALLSSELKQMMQIHDSENFTTILDALIAHKKVLDRKDVATETLDEDTQITKVVLQESQCSYNLSQALRKMSETYANKEMARQAERAAMSSKEQNEKERFEARLKSELARFREIEISAERRRLGEAHRREIAAIRAEANAQLQQREAALLKRQTELEREFSQRSSVAAETAKSERSQLVAALEDIRHRELATKRAGEIDRRALELHEARLKHQEANLAIQIKQLPITNVMTNYQPDQSVQKHALKQADQFTLVHQDNSPFEDIPETVSALATPESQEHDLIKGFSATPDLRTVHEDDQAIPPTISSLPLHEAQTSPALVQTTPHSTVPTRFMHTTKIQEMTPTYQSTRRHRSEPPDNDLSAENEALRVEVSQLRNLLTQARAAFDAVAALPPDRFSQRDLSKDTKSNIEYLPTKAEPETRQLVTAMLRRHLVGKEDCDNSELHSLLRPRKREPSVQEHSLEIERKALEQARKELEIQRHNFEQERTKALSELFSTFRQAAFVPATPTQQQIFSTQQVPSPEQSLPHHPPAQSQQYSGISSAPGLCFGDRVDSSDPVVQKQHHSSIEEKLQLEKAEREKSLQKLQVEEKAERKRRLEQLETEAAERQHELEQLENAERKLAAQKEEAAKQKLRLEQLENAERKLAAQKEEAAKQKLRLEQLEAAESKRKQQEEEALEQERGLEAKRRAEQEEAKRSKMLAAEAERLKQEAADAARQEKEETEAERLRQVAAEAERLRQVAAAAESQRLEEEERQKKVEEETKKQFFSTEQLVLFQRVYDSCATSDGLDASALCTALYKLSGTRQTWHIAEGILSADGPVTNFDEFIVLLSKQDTSLYRPPPELDADALYKKALERTKERRAAQAEAQQQTCTANQSADEDLETSASNISDGAGPLDSSLETFEAPPQETSGSSHESGWSFG